MNIIDTSTLSPPSADTAGVVYLSTADSLLACDSEVNAIPTLFTSDNLFEIDYVTPALFRIATTAFSRGPADHSCEPTGITYKPLNHPIFISDDNGDKSFEVDKDGDGLYGTSDDVITTSFSTRKFDSLEPEGVT